MLKSSVKKYVEKLNSGSFVDEFEAWLAGFINYEKLPDKNMFKLNTMAALCEIFGHPELSYRKIHIAGSKGKGSVSKMIAAILAEKYGDEKIGVFASPHVVDFRERVGTASGFFADEVYKKSIAELVLKIDGLRSREPEVFAEKFSHITWFELVTIFSFLVFRNAGVEVAVFEVGMGGRLDATNIIRPDLCCITSIELEHTEILGDTLEEIAKEKAGIIKNKVPVIVANQPESVKVVFRERARLEQAPIFFVDEETRVSDLRFEDLRMSVKIESEMFGAPLSLKMRMLGKVQAKNAAEATLAVKIFEPDFDEKFLRSGLEKACLPGRFEMRGNVILDGAHTVRSIQETLETLEAVFSKKKAVLLFGMAAGKDYEKIVPLLAGRFEKIFLTRPGDFKSSNLEGLEEVFKKNSIEFVSSPDFANMIKTAVAEAKKNNSLLLVTGSFYLAGEVVKVLGGD